MNDFYVPSKVAEEDVREPIPESIRPGPKPSVEGKFG